MEQEKIVLMDYLGQVPDPRQAQGKRHEWWVILAVLRRAGQWALERECHCPLVSPPCS